MAKRVFMIVLDSLGIGASPDASDFGDAGANTLHRISKSEKFKIDNLLRLGIGETAVRLDYGATKPAVQNIGLLVHHKHRREAQLLLIGTQ